MNAESVKIKVYGKSELAMAYLSGHTPDAATRIFLRWINVSPGLAEKLAQAAGATKRAKYYTPIQVRLIMEAFGEP